MTETHDNALVFEPELTRLDVQSVPAFKESSTSLLVPGKDVVMDLKQVLFIDSTGLGALLSLLRKIKENDGRLVLANASEQTLAMFRMVRMTRIFDIYETTEDALKALKA
ncbi:STAS domain-containing protein [Pontiellaceae bacterium B12227]|nr:STAS domain-containing protein [Pontiellaceae bacterium B12227]